jgi:hypothetical protein
MVSYAATRPSGLLAWSGLVFFGVLLLPRIGWLMWRLWRYGQVPKSYNRRYGDAWMRDFARVGPATVVTLTAGLIAVEVDYFFGMGTPLLKVLVGVFGVVFFAGGLLTMTIHYLHWPRWCIAPVLRDPERPRRMSRPQDG